ncbi:5-methyltetrahydropteroyltriglutamate--homocysteine S-methyltransferase [Secundilactobacillus similis]|uniref:5-methyltetrahydropteroyltriglutamate--homocysteine S-methyltransferase n=1 Tax=Secundilactobacillus similis DSM 23365 = JCM 2765 TaxID=1423804 RepID=A0A0R2FFZ3_9LACO|nr:5-methyltetrahydropteroyltriglutamate--homocysteine S-methyltransferase [Secundilactobacillus similis]KRN26566.1 5-methyltetrahydropteroyltriglutamate--homocysteine S-methyltransferase [Secundilactobacillus similis DSM 23365 = JCM 2765]
MTTYPYRADIVGSFLRPAALKQANADFKAGKIDREALTQVENREIDHLVDQQVKAGLKDVTAGEFRRSWWHLDFLGGLNGAEFFTPDHGFVFNGQETRAGAIRINGKIAFNPQHPFFDDFSYLKQIVPAGIAAKQTIPSPSVLFPNEDAMIYDNYYHDFDAFLADEIKAYQETVQHFYDLGCRYLQIDDTSWGMWASFSDGTINPDLVPLCEAAVKAINAIADNKPDDLVLTMHVCRGNYDSNWAGAGAYDPVADYLAQLHIDGYFLEYDDERSGGFEPLKKIAENGRHQRIVLGLVTTKRPELEDAELLKTRIENASQFVDKNELCLSPQCGFASTEEGNHLTEADQWAKIKLVVNTANEVWPN